MRPKLLTLRNLLIFVAGVGLAAALFYWMRTGAPLPGVGVASTAGKLVFLSKRGDATELYLLSPQTPADVVALTNSPDAEEGPPQWAQNGNRLTFTVRGGGGVGSPQVYVMDAAPNASVQPLTNTSGSKQAPIYVGRDQRIFYLDSGRVVSTDPATGVSNAILPPADKSIKSKLSALSASGGLRRIAYSPDGEQIAATLALERGHVLLLFDVEAQTLALVGAAAGEILPLFLPDGTLAATMEEVAGVAARSGDGEMRPLAIPVVLAKPDDSPDTPTPALELAGVGEATLLARFGATDGKAQGAGLPFAPESYAAASDNKRMVFAVEKGAQAGLYMLDLTSTEGGLQLYKGPCKQVSLSPDDAQVAFVAGKDIFVVPMDGSANPVNLTNGNGVNTYPRWSPVAVIAVPK